MNEISTISNDTLPALIDRAANALSSARTSGEVLEARDIARMAYDAAKSAGRMARAKQAHDEIIAAVYRSQADAAVIEARAKVRLADEYDAAQERGEVAGVGGNRGNQFASVDGDNAATAADIGLRRDEIHEARKLRDAEAATPGTIEAAASALVERGEEPTKAALRREVLGEEKHRKGLSGLTRDGLEDEVAGLRADLADAKAKIATLTSENRDLKAKLADLTDSDSAGVIRRLTKAVEHKGREVFQANEKFAAEKRKTYRLDKEIKELRAQLENQVFVL